MNYHTAENQKSNKLPKTTQLVITDRVRAQVHG